VADSILAFWASGTLERSLSPVLKMTLLPCYSEMKVLVPSSSTTRRGKEGQFPKIFFRIFYFNQAKDKRHFIVHVNINNTNVTAAQVLFYYSIHM
jgi:hypothetical protein